jgi:hypothetical protein
MKGQLLSGGPALYPESKEIMLKTGKLDNKLLEEVVFRHIRHRRPEVMTRPGIGEDCAVVDF